MIFLGVKMNATNLIVYLGITTFIFLVFSFLTGRRIIKVNIKWHKRLAYVVLGFALIHGVLAFLIVNGIISL
jgi:hypothetical protein